jgi:hypothetical protein
VQTKSEIGIALMLENLELIREFGVAPMLEIMQEQTELLKQILEKLNERV